MTKVFKDLKERPEHGEHQGRKEIKEQVLKENQEHQAGKEIKERKVNLEDMARKETLDYAHQAI